MYPGIVQQENLANTEEQLRRLLFGKGQEGVWFDPSDLSTMFQNPEGSLAVENDGDPISLVLDKHAKHLWPQLQNVESIDGVPIIGSGTPQYYPVASGLQPGVRYLITADIVDFEGTGDIGFRSVPGEAVMVPSRKEGDRFFAVCVEFTQVVDLEFYTRPISNTCNARNIRVYDVTQGNHATASNPANFTYRTDGTLHWIEHPGSGVMSYTPAPSTGSSDVCRFGAQFRLTDPTTTWGCLTSWSDVASGGYVLLSQMDSVATHVTQPSFNQVGPNRVNGTDFTGTRDDLYNELVSAPKVIGAVGLDLVSDDGHTVQFTGRYGTQAHNGTNAYGFIEYRGNLSQGVYEKVEQYLADKAGITLP